MWPATQEICYLLFDYASAFKKLGHLSTSVHTRWSADACSSRCLRFWQCNISPEDTHIFTVAGWTPYKTLPPLLKSPFVHFMTMLEHNLIVTIWIHLSWGCGFTCQSELLKGNIVIQKGSICPLSVAKMLLPSLDQNPYVHLDSGLGSGWGAHKYNLASSCTCSFAHFQSDNFVRSIKSRPLCQIVLYCFHTEN